MRLSWCVTPFLSERMASAICVGHAAKVQCTVIVTLQFHYWLPGN